MVRDQRDRLSPDVFATMRPAFRIFLEHLTQLCIAMEAHVVDALESNWTPPSWNIYIEVNRARVENRQPEIPIEDLRIHYRAMLRALVRPHRRNVPEHAIPIIIAASEVLPAGDSQLRSAVRRHQSVWKGPMPPPIAALVEQPGNENQPTEVNSDEISEEKVTSPTDEIPVPEPPKEPEVPVDEFESAWTK